eukprot:RCo004366
MEEYYRSKDESEMLRQAVVVVEGDTALQTMLRCERIIFDDVELHTEPHLASRPSSAAQKSPHPLPASRRRSAVSGTARSRSETPPCQPLDLPPHLISLTHTLRIRPDAGEAGPLVTSRGSLPGSTARSEISDVYGKQPSSGRSDDDDGESSSSSESTLSARPDDDDEEPVAGGPECDPGDLARAVEQGMLLSSMRAPELW